MNANELADAMEIRASIRRKATSRKSVTEGANDRLADQLEQAATMLRQQQAEIVALKNANRFIQNFAEEQHQRAVALEMRELTDEEIKSVWEKMVCSVHMTKAELDFARAILRKAQEK
jgi:translation initiation factor 2B subunit (eIF-2B alpha/beta/delta family)